MALSTSPVTAHHSLSSEFDFNAPLTLTGMVTKVDWGNPHALLYLDIKTAPAGRVALWTFQLPSPSTFARLGWKREQLQSGVVVIVDAYAAKDGSRKGSVQQVKTRDGRTLFTAISDPNTTSH